MFASPDIIENPRSAAKMALKMGGVSKPICLRSTNFLDVTKKGGPLKKSNSKLSIKLPMMIEALTLQGKKTYPIKNGILKMMIFRTSLSVGYVNSLEGNFPVSFSFLTIFESQKEPVAFVFGKVQTSLNVNLLLPCWIRSSLPDSYSKEMPSERIPWNRWLSKEYKQKEPWILQVDGSEIRNNHLRWCQNPVNNGIFYHINWWSPDFWTVNSSSLLLQNCKPIAFCCCHESYFA